MEQNEKLENANPAGGRRDFLKNVVVGGAALGVTAAMPAAALAATEPQPAKAAPHRVIDFHAHMVPPGGGGRNRPTFMSDIPLLVGQQKEAGIDTTVISNTMFTETFQVPPVEQLRGWNKWAGESVRRSEGRLEGLACAFPWTGDKDYVNEVRRSLKEDGMRGILVNSSWKGEYLDSAKMTPFYELALEQDVPIFVHPPYAGISSGDMEQFKLHEMVGRPCDTTLTMARLVLFGVLERYPALKIVGAHVGGGILMLPGRLNFGYEMRKDAYFGPWEPDVLSKPPSQYISMLYVDTMGFHAPAVQLAISTVGIDHVLLGSDHPPVWVSLKKTVETTMGLPISMADKQKVMGGNARRLLKMG